MTTIHSTAIVHPKAQLGKDVVIGPYAIVDECVTLGDHVEVKAHANITGRTKIGAHTVIYPFASIGTPPQNINYKDEPSAVEIGEHNTIREHVTINCGTELGGMVTRIGNNNFLMIGMHVGHDCQIGDHVIIANYVQMAGHVTIDDHVFVGGVAAFHQFVRVGKYVMVSGLSAITRDILPFTISNGNPMFISGINVIGLRRKGLNKEQIGVIRKFYQDISDTKRGILSDLIDQTREKHPDDPHIRILHDFIKAPSHRGICGKVVSEVEDELF